MFTYWYIYKNPFYLYDCLPLMEDIDLSKRGRVIYRNQQTNFLSDGKIFFSKEDLRNTIVLKEGNNTYLKFKQPLVKNMDWKTLKVINNDILVDQNNIYNSTENGV